MIHLEWYRIFLHAAKAGNLTKAAEELYITQPSVSYAIKQIEAALSMKLFHRKSKGVELTTEGKQLLLYVEQSFALLEAGEKKMSALKHLTGGELRVGASDSLFKHFLFPYLDTYRKQYPGVRIRLSHGKTSEITARVKESSIDFGLIHLPTADDPHLDVQTIMTLQDCFVGGEAYRDQAEHLLSAQDISRFPLLLLSPGSSTRRFIEQWFAAQDVTIEADIELGSIDLLIEFAKLGFGVAFVPRSYVVKELAEGTLHELKPAKAIPARSIGITTRRDMTSSVAAAKFLEMLSS
ncbi:LysR family transcriptional regulator [Paenibacillus alginolyticus]|uniref:LysR family transcriptional regulator n=1 Tax=Paenibacillus alginolyticus TaxID=59839 RepID=A0ABT4GKK2_9BACL|nr:LysR family transcriptional regulator [Paenibacillus alginolyticus]MCY9696732.1 LysR family transcriptional regulator [Paenibacillus alginolyticus]MEC0147580.1 LysR family transcriptional regulator [Paenibacillus alginolyticus]